MTGIGLMLLGLFSAFRRGPSSRKQGTKRQNPSPRTQRIPEWSRNPARDLRLTTARSRSGHPVGGKAPPIRRNIGVRRSP